MHAEPTSFSPLIHLVDDDHAVREALATLIGTVGLRVQSWPSPEQFLREFDRGAIGEDADLFERDAPGREGEWRQEASRLSLIHNRAVRPGDARGWR